MAIAVDIVVGVFFLAMGVYALAAPAALTRPFGVHLEQPAARYEIRAVYGGFGLAMAAMLAVAATHDGLLRTGILVTIGIALGVWHSAASYPRWSMTDSPSTPTGSTAWSRRLPRWLWWPPPSEPHPGRHPRSGPDHRTPSRQSHRPPRRHRGIRSRRIAHRVRAFPVQSRGAYMMTATPSRQRVAPR